MTENVKEPYLVAQATRVQIPAGAPPIAMGLRPIAESKIVNTLIKLKGSGLAESTLRRVSYELSRLAKHCNLDNSEDVNNWIANMRGSNSYKDVFVKSYSLFYLKIALHFVFEVYFSWR